MPRMRQSSQDKVVFSLVLVQKFAELEARLRRAGRVLMPPKSIMDAIELAKPMHQRFARGDLRHTDEEAQAEHEVSVWLVNEHQALHGNPPVLQPSWNDFTKDR